MNKVKRDILEDIADAWRNHGYILLESDIPFFILFTLLRHSRVQPSYRFFMYV